MTEHPLEMVQRARRQRLLVLRQALQSQKRALVRRRRSALAQHRRPSAFSGTIALLVYQDHRGPLIEMHFLKERTATDA